MVLQKISHEKVQGIEKKLYLCSVNLKTQEDMATTTVRKRTAHPMSYYWGVVKDMDDSQKLELVTMLIESVKPSVAEPPMKRYTMDDINAMLDEAEANFAAGKGIPHEEVMREWDEELERWEQEDLEMAEMV